jgi:hypothetical protein
MPIEEHAARENAPPSSTVSRLTLLLRLLIPFVFLIAFAGDLLRTYFSDDDFMNLYKYVQTGWSACRGLFLFWSSDYYRPAGAFLYLGLYHFFGLHPAPFKILVLILLLVNLAIVLFLARTLFRSSALAALVGILIAYHAAETQLYYSFGTIYDLACFTCMYAALALFIHVREQGRVPSARLLIVLAVLQIAALDSKEMAVTLPLILVLYEAFASPDARKRDFDPHAWVTLVLLGFIVLVYVVGKVTGDSTLSQNPLYRPEISAHKYVDSMSRYLDEIFYGSHVFHGKITMLFLGAAFALAFILRSRFMFFGWCWFLVALLPLNFIANRSGFVLYIPLVGLAVAIVAFVRDLFARLPKSLRESSAIKLVGPESVAFFLILAVLLFRLDRREKLWNDPDEKRPLLLNQQFAADMEAQTPNPTPHAHLLFLNDPFPADSWSAVFLPSLMRHDMTLDAARARQNLFALAAPLLARYDEVYDYIEPHLKRIQAAEVTAQIAALRAKRGFVEPGDGVWSNPGSYVWTKRVFMFRAGCPTGQRACHVTDDIFLPHEAYPDTALHHLAIKVDGFAVQTVEIRTDQMNNQISTRLDGRAPVHTLTYEFDATVPLAQHPADPRELGLVLRGAVITP